MHAPRPARRAGGPSGLGLRERLDTDLREAGFEAITHVLPRHAVGGATAEGQRWLSLWLSSLIAALGPSSKCTA